MSSVVIAGNTSGTVTLDAPAVAGTTVLTLPTTSGTVLASNSATTLNSGASAMSLQTNGTTAVTIDTNNNVGIGTTSPTNFGSAFKMLAVQGSDFGVIQAISNAGSTTMEMMGASGVGYIGTRTNHPLVLRTNDTERMRITVDGKIFMGAATAQRGSERLSMSAAGMDGIVVVTDSAALIVRKTSFGNAFLCLFENSGGTQVGAITSNGTNTTYTTTSDYRLKENIAPMMGALDTVAALKPVTYKWKATGEDGQGFIAHELQAVIPDCVVGEKDAVDEEGNIKPQGIDTSFLVATLTAAIQELKAELDTVKAELATLKQGAA